VNLDGPVRVADNAGAGSAEIKLSFDNWKGAKVAPTTHSVVVEPAKPGSKVEPVAHEHIATLTHPDRKATVHTVKFSDDGQRLFTAGYPSGIVQVWDWASKKELRRIDTPPGRRASANYALLTPDWKTLFVPFETRKVTSIEKDGKRIQRLEESGRIGVWNLETAEERPDLRPPANSGPYYAVLAPGGRHLISLERQSVTAGETQTAGAWVWDLETGARRKLYDGFDYPYLSPDGRTVVFTHTDPKSSASELRLLDFATGKELARLPCPQKDAMMYSGGFSPDGSVLTADLRGQKGFRPTILFLDAKTLAEKGRFVGDPDPDGRGGPTLSFAPDSKSCILLDMANTAHVWDVAASKVVRTFPVDAQSWRSAFSPDGRTWAVVWAPKTDQERVRDIDPRDLPQPRITLFDLAGDRPPRTLIAPHGFQGALAFSPDGKTLAFGTTGGVRIFDLTKSHR
jgi:WD40 repeat protein